MNTLEIANKNWTALATRLINSRSKKKIRQFKKRFRWYNPVSIQKFIYTLRPELKATVNTLIDNDFWFINPEDWSNYQHKQRLLYAQVAESFTEQDWKDFNTFLDWYAENLLAHGLTIDKTRKEIHDQIKELQTLESHVQWVDAIARNLHSWWD